MSLKQTEKTPTERCENTISFGSPTCDICREIDREDRDDEADFWPNPAIHYIRHGERRAVEWWGVTVCRHHDDFEHVPDGATHRIVDELEYVGDEPDRWNSSYKHNVKNVTKL